MKTLLIGFSDIHGRGQSEMLAGPEVDERDKAKTFAAAKSENKFPKKIVRIELWGETRGRGALAICYKANAKHENEIAEATKQAEAARAKAEADAKAETEKQSEKKDK